MSWVASSEWPPSSKKLSLDADALEASSSAQSAASFSSAGGARGHVG